MSARDWKVDPEKIDLTKYYPPTTDNLTVLNRDIEYYRAAKNKDEKYKGLTAIKNVVECALAKSEEDFPAPHSDLYAYPLMRIYGLLEDADSVVYEKRI